MIIYLYKAPHRYTVDDFFLRSWAPALSERFRLVPYDRFLRWRMAPRATYIFTDIDRLSVRERERAAHMRMRFTNAHPKIQCLNDPLQSRSRYALLRSLHESGVNEFNVYRIDEVRQPQKFPVFIRDENDHFGPMTDLLNDQEELENAIQALRDQGLSTDDKLIVEYVDLSDDEGFFKKYGDYRVGDRLINQHVLFRKNWLVKFGNGVAALESHLQTESSMAQYHPFSEQIMAVFDMAQIDYGRIDYGVLNGRVQVFEINTNPSIVPVERTTKAINDSRGPHRLRFAEELEAAFEAIDDEGGTDLASIDIEPWDTSHSISASFRETIYNALSPKGQLRLESLSRKIRDKVRAVGPGSV